MTISAASPASSASARERFAAVYRVLEEAIGARAFPGCAFGVLAPSQSPGSPGHEVVLADACGRFTYDADSPAVTAETVYDIASITKVAATTAAAMLLFERGVFHPDTPLGELLPGFVAGRAADDLARQVTLRHLLAHNSGLPGYVEFFRTASTPEALLEACLKLSLEDGPGERAEYSDPGFILLGKAIEAMTGESLSAFAEREIFAPIGLKATRFCPPPEERPSIPPTEENAGFRHRRIQGEVQDENAWLLGGAAGHAGLFSCVPDLLRLSREILEADDGAGRARLFSPQTIELFSERQAPPGCSRALGWDTPSENSSSGQFFSPHSIGHLGYSGCSLWIDLEAGVAVALLTNRTWPDRGGPNQDSPGRLNPLIRRLRPAFHDAVRQAL